MNYQTQPIYAPQAQTNFPLSSIICGSCKNRHSSVQAVKNCYAQNTRRAGVVAASPTPQLQNRRIAMTEQDLMVINMLLNVPDGYYCTQSDADDSAKFFRISRPKKGQYAGAFKLQTKHSDTLVNALIVWNPGQENQRPYWFNRLPQEQLLLIAVDPVGCAMRYSEKLNQCSRCTKDLTDGLSRWLSIGPDCQKVWPSFVETVLGRKGPYVPGDS